MLTATITSVDGTVINYHRLGTGPGLVLVHGGMESASSHRQLAEALAPDFTVYFHDRRGRAPSGPYGTDYSIRRDAEDLEALLTATGTEYVFGISSGALITLETALLFPTIRKAIAYEPPLIVDPSSYDFGYMQRCRRQIGEGDLAGGLVTGMKSAEMGPPFMNRMPDWLLKPLIRVAIAVEDRKAGAEDFTMRRAAPTLPYDFQLVREVAGTLNRYHAVQAQVLLLGGGKSPRYLANALDSLEGVLPNNRRTEFPELGHGGSGNDDRGGDPQTVAREISSFLAG